MSARFEVYRELEPVEDVTISRDEPAVPESVELTERWWWRLRAGNGEIVCRSSESYRDVTDAVRGAADAAVASYEAGSGPGPKVIG